MQPNRGNRGWQQQPAGVIWLHALAMHGTTTRHLPIDGFAAMAVIGCLPPLIFLIVGAGIGFAIGGTTTGIWGAIAGLVVGLVGTLVLLKAFERAPRRSA